MERSLLSQRFFVLPRVQSEAYNRVFIYLAILSSLSLPLFSSITLLPCPKKRDAAPLKIFHLYSLRDRETLTAVPQTLWDQVQPPQAEHVFYFGGNTLLAC